MCLGSYAVSLPISRVSVLADVRHLSDLVVCLVDDRVWVSGPSANSGIAEDLVTLPGQHYQWNVVGELTPVGKYLPTESLSRETSLWTPLGDWLSLRLPITKWPATGGRQAKLTLVASDQVTPAGAVLTTVGQLRDFVGSVPEQRFADLKFAATATGQAFVVGNRLPPVPGPRFWMAGRVAVPLGMHWRPAIDVSCLQAGFESGSRTVVWLAADRWQAIDASSFASVTRAAVRMTASECYEEVH